ncbi:hypothetical protein HPB47_019939 [Ixodes persulcatus]|uniref:Uncharacterized protein n=1 Tax=Ixodes persulcatus TaxID=34615 RepID=A0AC60QGR2_IXOPE|nr:hypothetical protein HPB47_019939 [Ixodes persulcatus]
MASSTTARCASWISGESSSPSSFGGLRVDFTPSALGDLARFHGRDECHEAECPLCLHHLADGAQARQALTALLSADPRSLHRKNNCSDRLYYCVVDVLHVTAWFDSRARGGTCNQSTVEASELELKSELLVSA